MGVLKGDLALVGRIDEAELAGMLAIEAWP